MDRKYSKTVSRSDQLSEKCGGRWSYHSPSRQWRCEDGNRYVQTVLTGKDMEGEYTGETSLCMYYMDNSKPPEWVYL